LISSKITNNLNLGQLKIKTIASILGSAKMAYLQINSQNKNEKN